MLPIAEAASRGDLVMILVPDELHGDVCENEIRDGIAEGNMILFGHGFSVHYGEVEPPPGVDVALVAPEGPRPPRPPAVQRRQRRAVPDRGRAGRDAATPRLALAYAKGIGGRAAA